MYSCTRAFVKYRGENERLTIESVGSTPIGDLLNDYALVVLILTHPAIDHEVSLDISLVQSDLYKVIPTMTVNDWLSSLGTASLPVSDTVPSPVYATVKYNDAFLAGYDLQKIHPTSGDGNQLPEPELRDIRMTKPNADYQYFYDHCLVTVNGLLHLTDYSDKGAVIKEGGRSVYYSNKNTIGIMSFAEIGKLKIIPITADMITARNSNGLKSGAVINLGEDIGSRVVMMSIGGILHFQNHHYRVTGDRKILIEWWKIPLAYRYHTTKKLLDLEPFDKTMQIKPNTDRGLDLNEANTDEAITAYLSLSQSFVILLDTDNFYVQRHGVERTGLAGCYYCYERPRFPLQLETGIMPAYLSSPEAGMFTIDVDDNFTQRLVHDTYPVEDDRFVSGAKVSTKPRYYSQAWLLEMGSEKLQF